MRIRRRRLRSALVLVGCLVGDVPFVVGDGLALPGAAVPGVGDAVGRMSGWVGGPAAGAAGGAADALRLASALVLLLVGSALHLWSKGCLEQNRRLVTAGPYRFTRNPFYLANGLVDLGLCALIGRWWVAGPYLVLWWLAYRETIGREEARLAALFPAEVGRYFERVPRLIPDGRALPRAEAAGRFTFDNPALARGSEYARLLGFFVAAAAVGAAAWLRDRGIAAFSDAHSVGLTVALLVPVGWVAKLALAEVHRRPETALLPFARRPSWRHAITVGCGVSGVTLALAGRELRWLAAGPILWLVLAMVDAYAGARLPGDGKQRAGAAEGLGVDGSGPRHRDRAWPLRGRVVSCAAAVVALVLGMRGLL